MDYQDTQEKPALGHYATFAWMWQPDGAICEYWILTDSESWHEAVRGDGHSYSPNLGGPLPRDMNPLPGETLGQFEQRVREVADSVK